MEIVKRKWKEVRIHGSVMFLLLGVIYSGGISVMFSQLFQMPIEPSLILGIIGGFVLSFINNTEET